MREITKLFIPSFKSLRHVFNETNNKGAPIDFYDAMFVLICASPDVGGKPVVTAGVVHERDVVEDDTRLPVHRAGEREVRSFTTVAIKALRKTC